ncbi:MAG: hypothetical protein ACKVZ0_14315 [Gemmatimonadales bacterium]
MTSQLLVRALLFVATAGLLGACGSTDVVTPPPPPPVTGIGPAGGTVSGPNGAQVVVPAGALSTNTTIGVTESSTGSPQLPVGTVSFGPMFAFTPHGTTFSVPVTITVPFTASSVAAGATPFLYKTNAAGGWDRVANATVNAGTMTALVTSFSFGFVGSVPPTITVQPTGQSVTEPAAASFSVAVSGLGPVTYQWQQSDDGVTFTSLVGATSSTYTTGATSVATDNGDFYRVLVSDGPTTISNSVRLVVTAPPLTPTWQQLGGAVATGPVASPSRDLFAAVALDLAGNPVVAWKGRVVGPGTSANFIHVKQWDGANWVQLGGNLLLASVRNGDIRSTPSIDVDPTTGYPVVAWSEESSRNPVGSLLGAFDVYVKRWTGSAWVQLGGALNVNPVAGAIHPKLRVTNTGTPTVAWWETPNHTAAKSWDGTAWTSFAQQSLVWSATGAQDLALTALTLDGSGNPFVVFGASAGPLGARPALFPANGWMLLPSLRTDNPAATGWGAAMDAQDRLTVAYSTFAGPTELVRVRRFESGAWVDLGGTLFTDNSTASVAVTTIAVPFSTSNPIASWSAVTQSGQTLSYLQSFRQWDGTAWQPLASTPLPHLCELAVPTNLTNRAAKPVAACVRSAGDEDIVVYRVVP